MTRKHTSANCKNTISKIYGFQWISATTGLQGLSCDISRVTQNIFDTFNWPKVCDRRFWESKVAAGGSTMISISMAAIRCDNKGSEAIITDFYKASYSTFPGFGHFGRFCKPKDYTIDCKKRLSNTCVWIYIETSYIIWRVNQDNSGSILMLYDIVYMIWHKIDPELSHESKNTGCFHVSLIKTMNAHPILKRRY